MFSSAPLTKYYYHSAYQTGSHDLGPGLHEKHISAVADLYTATVTTVTDLDGEGVCTCQGWDTVVGN